MNDHHKSKRQLIEELSELRQQLKELTTPQIGHTQHNESIPPEEADFKTLVENSPDLIIRFNQSMEFLFANALAIEILGIPAEDYIGKTPTELKIKTNQLKLWKVHIENIFIKKQPSMFEGEFINYAGQHFYYHARLVPELATDGSIESAMCTIRNISGLKKALVDLRASEKRNNQLLAALPDLLIFLSNEAVYLDYHATDPKLLYTSLEARLGKHISEIMPPEQAQKFIIAIERVVKTGLMEIVEYQLMVNNVMCFFEARIINFDVDRVLVIVRDTSELTRLQQELSRLDKLHLVGEMAASIGHEVRNPMTTVRGFLQLFSRKPEFTGYKGRFNLMIEELDRANAIISEFLSLAKNKALKLEHQNLNSIINTISPLIQSNATMSNKFLKLELEPIPNLLLDAQEIRQLILNIVQNGLEAMLPDTTITIKTFMDNSQVVMAIQDMGSGIPPEFMEKIGLPFFTTKEYGTGLGLAVCYSIVARHKASIEVLSNPKGTTFYIKFDQS
ncbi:ATP-binding protein [Pelosinus sp. sgz500959]|uniref:ATP-binding protein n=1 Tax=Pelosinus sp. sgz500959 TaxID=3242472 RepID=UPI003672FE1E